MPPAVIAVVAVAAAVAGTAVSAIGQIRQGQAAEAAAKYNAAVADQNAQTSVQTSEFNAQQIEMQGVTAEDQLREQHRRVLARQHALLGTSGVSVEGSPLLVMMDSAEQAELDALRTRYGYASQAQSVRYGGGVAAGQYQTQGVLQRFSGQQANQAGQIGAGSTLLTGAGRIASGYASGGAGGALTGG